MFKGADVVMNAASFDTTLQATRAAAKAGANYIDLGSPCWEAQLALSDEFRKRGFTAVLGLGTAPGATNIMACYLVDRLDRVESIHLKDGNVDQNEEEHTRPLYWAYDIGGIMDEFALDANPFLNGKITNVPAMSGEELFAFHEPTGTVAIGYTSHPEPETMSQAFKDKGIKNVTWKIGFAPGTSVKSGRVNVRIGIKIRSCVALVGYLTPKK